jgi:hypothetical protein
MCGKKIKACKQKLSELKKYENICLDIIGRVKISEYNFLCPFLSQGYTFF